MSNLLSYNSKTTDREGWVDRNQYNEDDIKNIHDSEGGNTTSPKTAIPTPFAQFDLVRNAFMHLSQTSNLKSEKKGDIVVASKMDEALVSYALDVAQLFFDYKEKSDLLNCVVWHKDQIEELKSEPEHKLLGDTLGMFLNQDAEAYNFDLTNSIFFLVYGDQVIGSTSPTSLFIATPNAFSRNFDIPVEEGKYLFGSLRPLHERDDRFVKYLFTLFGANPILKKRLGDVNKYLIKSFPLLKKSLQTEIQALGSYQNIDANTQVKCEESLKAEYDSTEFNVLGVPLYQLSVESITDSIQNSSFKIDPSPSLLPLLDKELPLVLQNDLNAPASDPYYYIRNPWNDFRNRFTHDDYSVDVKSRVLPQTNHHYPWLTTEDFFQPYIIKLNFPINNSCFFNGNLVIPRGKENVGDNGFLLPLKPLFFQYFNIDELKGNVDGKPMFELTHTIKDGKEIVIANLRVRVKGRGKEGSNTRTRFVTLTVTYKENAVYNFDTHTGPILSIPMSLTIFPFLRYEQYRVMLIDRAIGKSINNKIGLTFYKNGNKIVEIDTPRSRSMKASKGVSTDFYSINDSFDYIKMDFVNERKIILYSGIIYPDWPIEGLSTGTASYTFSVDFGTTNTHIEVMKGEETPEPLVVDSKERRKLIANLYAKEDPTFDAICKQEFLPVAIGKNSYKNINYKYTFPQRTVISESENLDAENADDIIALADANIPFIYEKEHTGFGNRIVPNLKWSTEPANSKRARAYMKELALLMRSKVLLGDGDLSKTRLVWFYPLSMKTGMISKLSSNWNNIFEEVFRTKALDDSATKTDENGNVSINVNVIKMPESIAPYYYYSRTQGEGYYAGNATAASVDIGGGTSDVTVMEPGKKEPTLVTSFRFAANVLFGDGFSDIPLGDSNPMVQKYATCFDNLFNQDEDKYDDLHAVFNDIKKSKKSEEINAFMFSIENNEVTSGNENFSYNLRLNEDVIRKPIFIYFYCTIIYYLASMMKAKNIAKPRNIMFSGTGSKVLNIVGNNVELSKMTQAFIEKIYGNMYDNNGFNIVMQKEEPKQITSRGALLQVRYKDGLKAIAQINNDLNEGYNKDKACLKIHFSAIDKENLIYSDMDNETIRKNIVDTVEHYNNFFIQFFEEYRLADRFNVDSHAWNIFKSVVNKNLDHHLAQGWNFVNRNQEKNDNDVIEDSLFFYPIIGSIRDNLLENLKEEA